jgi:bis(5'-adenosyl)-triphosphatase
VHVHILPRLANDFNRNDDIYDALQEWAPRDDLCQRILLEVPEDADRRDRTSEEMANEAKMYRDALM